MKKHWNKFRLSKKCVAFLMSSAFVFSGEMTMIANSYLSFPKSLRQIQQFVDVSKLALSSSLNIISFASDLQTLSISFFRCLQYISPIFSSVDFLVYKTGFSFFPSQTILKQNPEGSCFDIVLYNFVLNLVDNFELVSSGIQNLHKPQSEYAWNA